MPQPPRVGRAPRRVAEGDAGGPRLGSLAGRTVRTIRDRLAELSQRPASRLQEPWSFDDHPTLFKPTFASVDLSFTRAAARADGENLQVAAQAQLRAWLAFVAVILDGPEPSGAGRRGRERSAWAQTDASGDPPAGRVVALADDGSIRSIDCIPAAQVAGSRLKADDRFVVEEILWRDLRAIMFVYGAERLRFGAVFANVSVDPATLFAAALDGAPAS